MVEGRPFRGGRLAGAGRSYSWWSSPRVRDKGLPKMSKEEIERARVFWRRYGLSEHASVTAFAEIALKLMGVGAPASLVDDCLAAAREEVTHAQLSFDIVEAFGVGLVDDSGGGCDGGCDGGCGGGGGVGKLDLTNGRQNENSFQEEGLLELVSDALVDGCFKEYPNAVLASLRRESFEKKFGED